MKKCPKCGREYETANTLCPFDGAALETDSDALLGQVLADKYRIEERINSGGMGTVYRATHVLMDKTVAIKVLHPALAADEKIVARFSREAKAASRIAHPHALDVTDFGEAENGTVFMVMEYLPGKTLKQVIREVGPMPLPRIVEIMRQIGGALEAAHAEGVVHRDLKSDNIMLLEMGGQKDWSKVLDFGIAKIQETIDKDPGLTAPNLIIGTPQYMSPEQCSQAAELDARSDIYSLGVILFEMLVGHVPFSGESPTATMMKHLQEPAPSVLDERRDLPASVGQAVERALMKKPEDRFQKVGELVEALTQAAAEEVPAAASASAGEQPSPYATNRIVVTTNENESARATVDEDYDETTVVRPPVETPAAAAAAAGAAPYTATPLPAASFNPWHIAVPAIVLLAVVFIAFYAFSRDTGQPAPDPTQPQLTSDPNSLPAQPVTPPTGGGEAEVAPANNNGNANAAPQAGANAPPGGEEANANAAAPPAERRAANTNQQPQEGEVEEEEPPQEEEGQPTPPPANINRNRRVELPDPQPTAPPAVNPDLPPARTPRRQPSPRRVDSIVEPPNRPPAQTSTSPEVESAPAMPTGAGAPMPH